MRILVVGAAGLLGSNVVRSALARGWDVRGTFHSTRPSFDVPLTQFDLREHAAFGDVLDAEAPDAVVNCAAMTDVDECEAEPERAHLLNGEAPGGLAAACAEADVDFAHVSTDYVFDGTDRQPYDETADPNPLQAYGASKLAGERAVRAELASSIVLRLSFVWGVHRSSGDLAGFPAWVRSQLQNGDDVPLFTDQHVTPTRAGQAAETLLDLLAVGETGTYHVACDDCVTPYEFGELLADRLGADRDRLAEGSMDDVDRAATRPSDTCLATETVASVLGRPQPTLREDLAAVDDAL